MCLMLLLMCKWVAIASPKGVFATALLLLDQQRLLFPLFWADTRYVITKWRSGRTNHISCSCWTLQALRHDWIKSSSKASLWNDVGSKKGKHHVSNAAKTTSFLCYFKCHSIVRLNGWQNLKFFLPVPTFSWSLAWPRMMPAAKLTVDVYKIYR